MFAKLSASGISTSGMVVEVSDCRIRDTVSGAFDGMGNYPDSFGNDTTEAGADADARDAAELVDAANGDYRIKYGSAYWGKGLGAGDGPAPASGGGAVFGFVNSGFVRAA
jgi:hypothetical protein